MLLPANSLQSSERAVQPGASSLHQLHFFDISAFSSSFWSCILFVYHTPLLYSSGTAFLIKLELAIKSDMFTSRCCLQLCAYPVQHKLWHSHTVCFGKASSGPAGTPPGGIHGGGLTQGSALLVALRPGRTGLGAPNTWDSGFFPLTWSAENLIL